MNLSELQGQRHILDKATLGVVHCDLTGAVLYANAAAMHLLGADHYEGMQLSSFYEDSTVLREQLSSREAGDIGSYRTRLRRMSDGASIAVHVTATPIAGPDGQVVGSFALLRMPLEEEINRIHQEAGDANSVLYKVMQEVHNVVPFDVVTATRFSEDYQHCQIFFVYRPQATRAKVEWSKQWHWLPASLQPEIVQTKTVMYSDLQARLSHPDLAHLQASGTVAMLLAEGIQTCIRRPLRRHDKLIASVTFYSRQIDGFSEVHRRSIEELPIMASVMQAIDYADRRRDAERYKLLREVAYCPTMEAVYEALLRRLCDIFLWTNVAIYRVDHSRGRIKLVAACQAPHPPVIEGLDYEQDIDVGILGRVVSTGSSQIVGNVQADPDFVLDDHMKAAASELSWPVCVEESKVRWIIDVTDDRINSFAAQELRWLGEVAREVGGTMQRLSTLSFLSACLDSASDPIVVVDAHRQIKRANPAAAQLFGAASAKDVAGDLASFFDTVGPTMQALSEQEGYLGEFLIKHPDGHIQAGVSRKPLPEDTGGAIFVFKDMRPIRRGLQLELMEKTTYEIALETRTPLMYATAALERIERGDKPLSKPDTGRVLQYLRRVQHAYTKLAMFNQDVRNGRSFVGAIDLGAELRTIHQGLPGEMRELVRLDLSPTPARIQGDCFEVTLMLETLLLFFVRTAPEQIPVLVRVEVEDALCVVGFEGFLPNDWGLEAEEEGQLHPELRLAHPLIKDLMHRNGGHDSRLRISVDRVRHALHFPATPEQQGQ